MGINFAIKDWAACAPGLSAPAEWRAWAAQPGPPHGAAHAELAEMAPMLRRRLAGVGRMAARVAWRAHGPQTGLPVVLASRYGDAERALRLLADFVGTGAMSPADFTLSVHNAIGAVYSIARGDTSAYSSIAAGASSAAHALIEASGLLADGAPEVLLVHYDAPLPGAYADFADEPASTYAWAWRIAAAVPGERYCSLAWTEDAAQDAEAMQLPFGLEAMRFAALEAGAVSMACDGQFWTWRWHDA